MVQTLQAEAATSSRDVTGRSMLAKRMAEDLRALPPDVRRMFMAELDAADLRQVFAACSEHFDTAYYLWEDAPADFVTDILGETIWSKQRDVLNALVLPDVKRVIVPAGFGLGKTHVAAKAICWFGCVYPVGTSTGVTTATRMRQVIRQLWPHVRKTVARAGLPGVCDTTQWKMMDRLGVETVVAYGFCYADDTEILTRDGWLPFQKLTEAEDVATRSPDGRFEWQRPTLVVDDPYDGPMIRFKSQVYDLLVTPNHRMLVRRKLRRGVTHRPGGTRDWHIRRAEWFTGTPNRASGFEMPATSTWDAPSPAPMQFGPHTIDPEVFARFLGLYLAEGWTSTGTDHPRRVTICQSVQSTQLDDVRAILDATGLPWSWSPGKDVAGKFYVTCAPLAEWLLAEAYTGHIARSWTKRIPAAVKEWPADLLAALIEGAMIGDGHTEAWGYRRYLTTSERYADDLVEVAQKAGQEAWIDAHEAHPTTWGRRRQYRVNFRPGEAHEVPTPTVEHYQGRVGCVSVPNGIIYVRRNGRPAWCGNTAPEHDESAMQGIHAARLLLVVDEAGGFGRVIGNSTRNLLTGDARMLAIGNPATDDEQSWFETAAEDGFDPDRTDTVTIPIAATDSPAITGEESGLCMDCPRSVPDHPLSIHLVDDVWVKDAIREHGEDAPYVVAKVYAKFPKGGGARAIPASFVDAGMEQASPDFDDVDSLADGQPSVDLLGHPYATQPNKGAWIRLGVDVAADGGDEFVIARAEGSIARIRVVQSGAVNQNSVDVAGKILEEIRAAVILAEAIGTDLKTHPVTVKVDAIGVGWGVVSTLESWVREGVVPAGVTIIRVVVSELPDQPDDPKSMWRPKNKRAELWLNGRQLLTPDPSGTVALRLDVDHKVAAQLRAPKYGTDASGRQYIEKKTDIVARMGSAQGKSPDRAEALLLAVYEPRNRKKVRILA